MKLNSFLIRGMLAAAGLQSYALSQEAPAQTPAPAAPSAAAAQGVTPSQVQPSPGPTARPGPPAGTVYVRRFSAGGIFSVQFLSSIPSKTIDQTVSTDLSVNSKTEAEKRLFGGGIALQVALTNRFAIAADVLIRRASFKTTDITYFGVDDTTTDVDERTYSTKTAQTRADLLDIPVLLRYYTKDRTKPGRRRFYEAGASLRHAHGIHTFGQTVNTDGTVSCCDETAMVPSKTWLPGAVLGIGYQFIDDMKIRIVPEIRYTRWFGSTFNTLSTQSRADQIEATVSITF